jgi:hypothetical protein
MEDLCADIDLSDEHTHDATTTSSTRHECGVS